MFDAILHRFLKDLGMPWGGRGGRRTLKWSYGAGPPRTLLAVFSPGWLPKGPGERFGRIWSILGGFRIHVGRFGIIFYQDLESSLGAKLKAEAKT